MLAALLAPGFDPQPTPPTRPGAAQQAQATSPLDGTWTVICAEKDGQKLAENQNHTVTIRGNVLTWNKDGQEHRVHLQFAANHRVIATPEAVQHAAPAPARAGEQQQARPAGTTPKPGEPAQAPGARDQNSQRPGTTLPAPAQAAAGTRETGTPGQHPAAQGGPHEGFFIETSDFLCLAFDQGFGGEMHGKVTAAAANPATRATPIQPAPAAPRPGQPATNPQQATNPQAAAGQLGGIRTANYAPGAENMQHGGFVLILHKQGGQQPTGQQPTGQQGQQQPVRQQPGVGAK
jgi:hypothetical protein